MANQPPNPVLDPEQDPSLLDETVADQPDQAQPSQTPLDTLNDILDMGEDVQDTIDQVKDLKEKFTKKPGADSGAAEAGAAEGTAAAEGAAGTEAAASAGTVAGAESAAGAEALGATAAKGGAEKALRQEAVAAGRSGWLKGAKNKVAAGRAKVAARQAARQAEKQALKQTGKAAAKFGAKAAARWTAEAASGLADAGLSWILLAADVILTVAYAFLKKYGKYVFAFFALLIALPGLIFAFYFGMIGAKLTAGTPAEKAQTVVALALGADPNSTRDVIIKASDFMRDRLTGVIRLLPAGSAAIGIAEGVMGKLTELTQSADNVEQRRALMAEINADLRRISDAHPEVLYNPGTCADLKKYVDEGKFRDPRRARQIDINSIHRGFLNRGGHRQISRDEAGQIPADPKLCNVIKFILDNGFTIGATTMTYGHRKYTSSNNVSQHYVGQAIDLAMINGVAYGNARWKAETEKLMTLLRSHNAQLKIYQMIGPHPLGIQRCANSTHSDDDHANHIHIGVASADHIKRYETCR